jgi:hypothetical protein
MRVVARFTHKSLIEVIVIAIIIDIVIVKVIALYQPTNRQVLADSHSNCMKIMSEKKKI